MIIAVTGANGSIGKELIPFLENLGHQVLIISSSTSDSEDNIFSYLDLQNKQIPFKADILMHLASINSNLEENQIDDEIDITKKILSALPSLQCKQIIFFSTSKVYGDNSFDMNYFEESSPLKPKCYYGKAKKICEELIFLESKANTGLKIKDLTGAGDLFAAGYLHGIINKLSLRESLNYGTNLSSKVIQQIGARIKKN